MDLISLGLRIRGEPQVKPDICSVSKRFMLGFVPQPIDVNLRIFDFECPSSVP